MRYRPKRASAIDLDRLNQFEMLRRFFNARYMGKTVMLKRSPSGKGYHIHAEEGFSFHEALMLGDCPGRLLYWSLQGYTFTFQARLNWHGRVIGREEEENPLALPFWSRIPSLKKGRDEKKWSSRKS